MQRLVSAGRLGLIIGLGVTAAACTQWQNLVAMKHFKDGNTLYQQGEYERAATAYEEAIASDPNLPYVHFYLGNSYDNLYRPSRAGEADNDALLQKAIEHYQASATNEQDPKIKKLALEYLVATYGPDKLNQPDQAEPLIRQMITLDPSDPTNYFRLSKLYEDSGLYAEAEQMLVKAREVRPDDATVYVQLAGYYNRQGEFEKTIEALQERARREPENPEAFYTLATYYWDKSYRDLRLPEAQKTEYAAAGMEAVDRAIQLNPDYMEAVTYRGLLLRVQALLEDNAGRQKELLTEADRMQARAEELRKKRQESAAG
jgi:tetratricopeptide (TPR) repeat protein